MDWLAVSIDQLVDACRRDPLSGDFDVIIIGSGYGGSVMAARLARLRRPDGQPIRLAVLERGREYVPGEFPSDIGTLPGHVRIDRWDKPTPIGKADALFNFQINPDVSLLTGSALGGGSQINANVAIEAKPAVLSSDAWPRIFRESPELLAPYYERARRTLGVTTYPGNTAKYHALRNVAWPVARRFEASTGCDDCEDPPRFSRAPIAVTFDATHAPGDRVIEQSPCIECGNCVSGCNHWAKNTLTMNYLPLARSWGAQLYTGVTVTRILRTSTVEGRAVRDDQVRWQVQIESSLAETAPDRRLLINGEPVRLTARRVIVAAGAPGSAELLLRSQWRDDQPDGLQLSPRLGQGFTTNGDMISAAYWQREPVNAVGFSDEAWINGERPAPVGPTITSMIDLRDSPRFEQQVLIEDGAIPAALGEIWTELLATASLPHQLSRWRSQARRHGARRTGHADMLLVSDEAAQHSQLLLAMGHDEANGVISLREPAAAAEGFQRARIDLPKVNGRKASAQPVFEHQSDWLEGVESSGAIKLDNPLWKPLPDDLATTLAAGDVERGTLMTVHPLGGCRMADEAALGVVNADGQVFDGDRGAAVHPGLYVCDGSILPSSLGANPLLTISALAERQAERLIETMCSRDRYSLRTDDERQLVSRPRPIEWYPRRAPAGVGAARAVGPDADRVSLRFRERLRNQHDIGYALQGLEAVLGVEPAQLPAASNERKRLRLALDVQLDIDDVGAYVRAPLAVSRDGLRVSGSLSIQHDVSTSIPGQQVQVWRDHQVELRNGEFRLFEEPRQNALVAMFRGVCQFLKVRGRHTGALGGIELRKILMYLKLCRQVGIRRRIDYRFTLTGKDGRTYELSGRKHVEFADRINPWLSLADVDAKLRLLDDGPNAAPLWQHTLRLDPLHVVRHMLPQVTRQPHAPAGILALASYGMIFARALAATHLFHFREPDYEPASTPRRLLPGPLAGLIGPEHHWLTIDDPADAQDDPPHPPLQIGLTRYRAQTNGEDPPSKGPVIIFHGILHSSLAFATDTIDENLTQHLCKNGYDVWLCDFRTSIAFGQNPRALSFDRIARHDVPAAIDHVLSVSGASQVNVFAHCMGAAVFSMAMLGNFVDPARIRSLCYCQVSFLVINAYGNLLRAEAIALVRDMLDLKTLNPRVDDSATGMDRLLDRIAFTYPVGPEERDAHDWHGHQVRHDTAVCNRLNLLIGTHWFHRNLDPRTHERLSELLGPSHVETFFQIHHFGMRGRAMNAFGENVYVTDDNLRRVFSKVPTFFIQGSESDVFDTRTTSSACERLQELTGAERHRCKHYPNYGHLECVFGKDAARVVYPDVVEFFDNPPCIQPKEPPVETRLRAADVGPLLGAATPLPDDDAEAPNGLLLRIWYAPQVDSSDLTEGALVCVRRRSQADQPLRAEDFHPVSPARDTTSALTPYVVIDLPVPAELLDDDLQIVVASKSLRNAQRQPAEMAGLMAPCACPDARPLTTAAGDCGSVATEPSPAATISRRALKVAPTQAQTNRRAVAAGDPGLIDLPVHARPVSFLDIADEETISLLDPAATFETRSVELSRAQLQRLRIREPRGGTRLLLASCRHPGNFHERELSERIFAAMAREVAADPPVSAAVFSGDQIYADATANLGATRLPRERVTNLYAAAFRSQAARDLLRRVPCLMAGDDHEIIDNWAGVADPGSEAAARWTPRERRRISELRQRASWAREAFEVFQWECSEGARATPNFTPGQNRLWFPARLGGFAYFVVDGRFERSVNDATQGADRLMSDEQLAGLLAWIDEQPPSAPCFIVTSAAPWPPTMNLLAHNAYLQQSDGWARYPREFLALLDHLARRNRRNVVILCGDAHCSLTAQVRFRMLDTGWSGGFTIVQSSGLYTPYPFANDFNVDFGVEPGQRREFSHCYQARGTRVHFDWTVVGGTDLRSFAVIDVDEPVPDRWQLSVSHRDEDGAPAVPSVSWPLPF